MNTELNLAADNAAFLNTDENENKNLSLFLSFVILPLL